jgi:hypothetical protein
MNEEDQDRILENLRSIAQCAVAAQDYVRQGKLDEALVHLSDCQDDAQRAESLIVKHLEE